MFITPGTPRIVIISYSINYGVKKCLWTALGDIFANIIQATLVIFVIGSFFIDYPILLKTLKWMGVLYLCYLAYDIYYRSNLERTNSKKTVKKSYLSFFKDGFNKLAGNKMLKEQIINGLSEKEIKQSWKSGVENFKLMRSKYLIYN